MADSPLSQFEITPIVPLHIGGTDVSFSNSALFMVAGVLLATLFFFIAGRKQALVPGRAQGVAEVFHEFIDKLLADNAGPEAAKYFPFIFSIFMFVLMGNLLGMLPFGFAYTSHIVVTFALAMLVILTVVVVGFAKHGFKFFTLFVPHGVPIFILPLVTPIEVISFLARPFSLSMRLFLNMMAGHMVLKIFAGFTVLLITIGGFMLGLSILPFAMKVAVAGFEFFVAFLQAYIFAVFSCIYLRDAIYLHTHEGH